MVIAFVKHIDKLVKVKFDDILFFEADGHYCRIHIKGKKYLLRISLNQLKERLPQDHFLSTHRSFLVHREKIIAVDVKESTMDVGGQSVPISKRSKSDVLKLLNLLE